MTKQSFIQGTLTLVLAGMITRFLGFINRIVLARIMGNEGIGLYMMALPTLFLMITISQIGFPIAIAKLVAEANMRNDIKKIKQIMMISFIIIACTSLFVMVAIFFSLPFITSKLLTDQRTIIPLLAICPIVPIIGISAVIKGYFQGVQNMRPQSNAIILEQIFRLGTVFFLVKYLLPFGIEYGAAGALASVLIGEIVSLCYLVISWKKNKVISLNKKDIPSLSSSGPIIGALFAIALPNSGSKWVNSIANFFEPIAVVQALKIAGIDAVQTTKQYGELTGYALPVLFLPTFITNAISIAIVPSIASIDQQENMNSIHYRLHQAIRLSFISGAFATIIILCFSSTILTHMYQSSNAKSFLLFMAPFFLFLYVQAPIHSALFGLGLAKQAMRNSILGVCVKFIVLFGLATNAVFGIHGLSIALCISIITITYLHLYTLHKHIRFHIPMIVWLKFLSLLTSFFAISYVVKIYFTTKIDKILPFLLVTVCLFIVYCLLIFFLKLVKAEEWKQVLCFIKK